MPFARFDRRRFLALSAGFLAAPALRAAAEREDLRGIYPIMQTPYLDSGGVDFDTLAEEARFLDRVGSHGMVWPQLASEYFLLTEDERMKGMEALAKASRGLKPKLVLGVQAENAEQAVAYARHANHLGPAGIIALPPREEGQQEFDLDATSDYYRAVAEACPLPLFVQAIGNMSVEYILGLAREIPTLQYVKDEAGHTLSRITEFSEKREGPWPQVFTGAHGRTLIDEMARGAAGSMPAASWVELYVDAWDLWHDGYRSEAIDLFSKVMLFVTQAGAYGLPSLSYVLHMRGVFPNWKVRSPEAKPLDEESQQALRRTYEFVKPYLRA